MTESAGRKPGVLIIVQNLPVPFDSRVWQEACALNAAGYATSVICPKGKGYERAYEKLDGIDIYRHDLPKEATRAAGFIVEYLVSLFYETRLAWRVWRRHGFEIIHACNPPDLIFLIALPFKLMGKKFIFDHHDINPEFYIAKFGRKDIFYKALLIAERLTFACADASIATNGSYREIAIRRGRMRPDRVTVVRSGPRLERLVPGPAVPELKNGKKYLVGYLGVMGNAEGLDQLLLTIRHLVVDMKRNDIHFGLVGGGPELENLKAQAKSFGLDDCVTFTGRVSDFEMLRWLNTADVCVGADPFNDMNNLSTMNKVVEYMALGKPIVQYDVREGRVSAGEASLYARNGDWKDLAEKIAQLLDDPEQRQRMGAFGRRRVIDELAWNHQIPKLLAAYDMVLPLAKQMSPRARADDQVLSVGGMADPLQ